MSTRLDRALVQRGLAPTRTQAQLLVRDGLVHVDGEETRRAAHPVPDDAEITVVGAGTGTEAEWVRRGWVGRGAVKLAAALEAWPDLVVRGRRCLDVGASTGGFTQVLLEHGAASVVALDVGHDQLAQALRDDPRVLDLSGVSVRDVDEDAVGGPVDVLVGDLSFISLRLVLPVLAGLVRRDGDLVLLVKPQFEVGADALGRGGVVRSARQREEVLLALDDEARRCGLAPQDLRRSPLRGGTGNVEFLWRLRRCSHPAPCPPSAGMMGCGPGRTQMAALARTRAQEDG
ncbi:RNA binding methyltransferase FtsJ like [Serinicoccus hydrothermalis]|uniref:RNA binding methyltransferase FtsJ like n=1 Tax=Serinicoccus hydrothermalis TaxID=1758689 RepID=A0A1B1N809_9MICO|nr:TlyA family RNA methyltransferase [Serinicoccus hydrothermalis]ANS77559.1 RNA binding methyltransferase FtsJ like [Serinicoccus hydrothermalis]